EPGSGLAQSIEAVVAFCGTIQCGVLSSSVTNETAVLSPSGNITARVAPQDLNKFLDFVGKQGQIARHATESEDKTAAVVDVEAKLKNQTEFRDSLRRMLTKPGVSVAALSTAVAAIIPWLIVIIPGLWFLTKAIRRFRERRRAAKAATPAA